MNPDSDDNEDLDDIIKLDLSENLPVLENFQLIEPGISDLRCESEDDCTCIEPDTFHIQPDLRAESVTICHSNSVNLKPMSIKLVDCFKIPWYFDGLTKNIVKNKFALNRNAFVNDEIIEIEDSSENILKEADNCTKVEKNNLDMSMNDSEKITPRSNDCVNEIPKLSKKIDPTTVKEFFGLMKTTRAKRFVDNKKIDMDIRKAMEQRENSVVDLKRNVGLIGMKILRLPNTGNIPMKYSKKCTEINLEKKKRKGQTDCLQVNAVDETLMNIGISSKPAFKQTNEIFGRIEEGIISNDKSVKSCNLENELILNKKIAEEILRLAKPTYTYAEKHNQSLISCNSMTKAMKPTEENIKESYTENHKPDITKSKISEGNKTIQVTDPMPFPSKHRNINQSKTSLQFEAVEMIVQQLATKSKGATTKTNSKIENIEVHKAKKYYSANKTMPKISLSTKKPNKFTESIFKIKVKQQEQMRVKEPTNTNKQRTDQTSSFAPTKSTKENSSLPVTDANNANNKNVSSQEHVFMETNEEKYIKKSSIIRQGTGVNNSQNLPKNNNHLQKTAKNKSTDSNAEVATKTLDVKAETVSKYNSLVNQEINTKMQQSETTKRDEGCTSKKYDFHSQQYEKSTVVNTKLIDSVTKEVQPKLVNGVIHPTELVTNYTIPTIITNRENPNSNFYTKSFHNPAAVTTRAQNNQSQSMTKPLTVYNSMQAHTLYKPPQTSYQLFQQNPYAPAINQHYQSNIPQMIHNNTGNLLPNPTYHSTEGFKNNKSSPCANDDVLQQNIHSLPGGIPTVNNLHVRDAMLNDIVNSNMSMHMRYPSPRKPSNEPLTSPDANRGISQISKEPITSQISMNNRLIPVGGLQSYDVVWSGSVFPPNHRGPPQLPLLQTSLDNQNGPPPSLRQSMDSSIIGRNSDGLVKKINITAPTNENKEDIKSKAEIVNAKNVYTDNSTLLSEKGPTADFKYTEPVYTKQELLEVLNTSTHLMESYVKRVKHNNANQKNSSYDTTSGKLNNVLQKISSPVDDLKKPGKEHRKHDKLLPRKKENQFKNSNYLMTLIKKPKENKDKIQKVLPDKLVAEVSGVDTSSNKNMSIKQSKHAPVIMKANQVLDNKSTESVCQKNKFKQTISSDLNFKIEIKSKKLTSINNALNKLSGDSMKNPEKVTNSKKNTDKLSSPDYRNNPSDKNTKSFVNLKRPNPNDDNSTNFSAKYRPGPLSKKNKLGNHDGVKTQEIHKNHFLASKGYSDPILPIPTFEKILSDNPYLLSFKDKTTKKHDKLYFQPYKKSEKTSGSVNESPKKPKHLERKRVEKEKERQRIKSVKKITIDEYKKRSISERRVDHEAKDKIRTKSIDVDRRASYIDSDLGYDSDSTVKVESSLN